MTSLRHITGGREPSTLTINEHINKSLTDLIKSLNMKRDIHFEDYSEESLTSDPIRMSVGPYCYHNRLRNWKRKELMSVDNSMWWPRSQKLYGIPYLTKCPTRLVSGKSSLSINPVTNYKKDWGPSKKNKWRKGTKRDRLFNRISDRV